MLNKHDDIKIFGLNIVNSNENSDNGGHNNAALMVTAVPKCFLFKKLYAEISLIELTEKLLIEIAEKMINRIGINTLPLTIHNVIASEACHGNLLFFFFL